MYIDKLKSRHLCSVVALVIIAGVGVSHKEMIRASSLTIDPCTPLQYLCRGLDKEQGKSYEYIELPYKLGILMASTPNPISHFCD